MSNINTQIPFNDLKIPEINSVEYAEGLQGVFDNINDNFKILANHDFIKGESGDSIEIVEYPLFKVYVKDDITSCEPLEFEKDGKKIILDLRAHIEKNHPDDLDVFSYLVSGEESPKINIIQSRNAATGEITPISSLYYVFLDGRFNNKDLGVDESIYQNISDASCILVWNKNNGFESLNNAFPKIVYEQGVGLCWQINGVSTGLPIRGKAGINGMNAKINIVKIDDLKNMDVKQIYFYNDGFSNVNLDSEEIEQYDNTSALIIYENDDHKDFYFGQIYLVKDNEGVVKNIKASFDTAYPINYTITAQSIIDIFKNIDISNSGEDASDGLKGLFIPMGISGESGELMPAHLISAKSANDSNSNELKTDLMIAPVNDINKDIDINTFGIDKYLYIKVNKDSNIFSANNINVEKNSNFVLKYKLVGSVRLSDPFSDTAGYFAPYEIGKISNGSRYYGKTEGNKTLTQNNTIFDTNIVYENHFDSMSESALQQLTHSGLYRWELFNEYQPFDVKELTSVRDASENPANFKYDFDNCFKVIYTETLTPNVDTQFIWFNGMDAEPELKDGKYVIPGWADSEVFSFVKFIPVYKNDYDGNTVAVNINYNVNITGSKDDPYKNLAVNGAITSNDLSVYGGISAGKFNNIYTEDKISAKNGIVIGDNDNCIISADGSIDGASAKFDNLNVENFIETENMKSSTGEFENISIKPTQLASVNISKSNINENAIGITATNVNEITIYTADNDVTSVEAAPLITSNVPAHFNDNSNIVLSNQTSNSDQIYFKNTLTNTSNSDAGTGVSESDNINVTTFEGAKNFNMHRLSLDNIKTDFNTVKREDNCSKNTVALDIITGDNSVSLSNIVDKKYNSESIVYALQTAKLNSEQLSLSNGISMTFDSDFIFKVNVRSKCDNGYRACLNKDSYIKLKLAYNIDGGSIKYISGVEKLYKFNTSKGNGNATSDVLDDNGYEWIGYNEAGSPITQYSETDRFYTYVIKPIEMNVSYGSSEYKKIVDALKNNHKVELCVIPEVYIKAHSQQRKANKDNRKLIRSISVSNFTPIIRKGSYSSQIDKIDKYEINSNSNIGKVIYYEEISSATSSSGVKATTICNDGIVMRAGEYVFGLGYSECIIDHAAGKNGNYNKSIASDSHYDTTNTLSKIPVLFYHKYDANMYTESKTPKNGLTNIEGYASRMNAIPLEDIFKCIKAIRENDQIEFGL